MINPAFLLLWVLVILQIQVQAADVQSSEQLINKMSDAIRNLNYEGVFVFTRNNKIDTMRILHKFDGQSEREKIISLTGSAREIIRTNQTVTGIFPDTQEVMVEKSRARSFASKLPDPIEAIADFYEFSTAGEERIAGRDTWIVNITPKDNYRYGHQLWIDKATYLLLKSELRDESGEPLEQVMFTQLELHESMGDELFNPSITGKEYTWYQYTQGNSASDVPETGTPRQWQVMWMPSGFKLSNYDSESMSTQDIQLEHMIYSDGVSMVSIFIEKLGMESSANNGSMNIGGVNVYARTTNGYQVTAIGEVPQTTVKRMVDSVVAGR